MKIYLIFSKEELKIVDTWNECQSLTKGIKGKKFKSFKKHERENIIKWFLENILKQTNETKDILLNDLKIIMNLSEEELNNYIENSNSEVIIDIDELNKKISCISQENYMAFVDGSYKASTKEYSYGLCIIKDDKVVYEAYNKYLDKNGMRQINGELKGALLACQYAIKNNIKKLYIGYDYAGIEQFALRNWKSKNEIINFYVSEMNKYMKLINIEFLKIKSHKKCYWNEYADKLCKAALGIK